jgi:hypothetical protein
MVIVLGILVALQSIYVAAINPTPANKAWKRVSSYD